MHNLSAGSNHQCLDVQLLINHCFSCKDAASELIDVPLARRVLKIYLGLHLPSSLPQASLQICTSLNLVSVCLINWLIICERKSSTTGWNCIWLSAWFCRKFHTPGIQRAHSFFLPSRRLSSATWGNGAKEISWFPIPCRINDTLCRRSESDCMVESIRSTLLAIECKNYKP